MNIIKSEVVDGKVKLCVKMNKCPSEENATMRGCLFLIDVKVYLARAAANELLLFRNHVFLPFLDLLDIW